MAVDKHGEQMWGPMNEADALRWSETECRIFPCGKCSNTDATVYHNLAGPHVHRSAADLLIAMRQIEQESAGETDGSN